MKRPIKPDAAVTLPGKASVAPLGNYHKQRSGNDRYGEALLSLHTGLDTWRMGDWVVVVVVVVRMVKQPPSHLTSHPLLLSSC